MVFENTREYAERLDADDPLKKFRERFYIPILHGRPSIYFTGNSLGLQPKTAQDLVLTEMEDWANFGSEMRVSGRNPWLSYHKVFSEKMAPIVGARPAEVIVMNQLSVNLHLMLSTFYCPSATRTKILYEQHAFSSDVYALQSHLTLSGLDISENTVQISARPGEEILRTEDIVAAIEQHKDDLALVFIGGVNYYTGQFFDIESITRAAHDAGAICGFDLAHAVGNVPLSLHDWNVDFAVWCSYKYLNGGPGAVGGAYIHQRYALDTGLPRLAGWWGNEESTRFSMDPFFRPAADASGWQLSVPPLLNMAMLRASLDIYEEVGMQALSDKGKKLAAWFHFILNDINKEEAIKIITPATEAERGCQLSFRVKEDGKHLLDILKQNSVIADWKDPDVIRIAAVPLYNTFTEVFEFGQILKRSLTFNTPQRDV